MVIVERERGTVMSGPGPRRELARRASNGIEVVLYWSAAANRVTVEVFDDQFDEGREFEVDGCDALDAFNHPYAYEPAALAA
jgi:hypothetical protein